MKVSELIDKLKEFPMDMEVAAMNTTNGESIVGSNSISPREAVDEYGPVDEENDYKCHSGPYVLIVGGCYS